MWEDQDRGIPGRRNEWNGWSRECARKSREEGEGARSEEGGGSDATKDQATINDPPTTYFLDVDGSLASGTALVGLGPKSRFPNIFCFPLAPVPDTVDVP